VIRALNPSHEHETARIAALHKVSYAVEAALIGSFDIPPLREPMHDLACCGEMVGAVSYKVETGVMDVHRLVVHPQHFHEGIARSLLKHIEDVEAPLSRIVVSTGSKKLPARSLYRRLGFAEKLEVEVARGLRVTLFEKVVRDDVLLRVWP
jgi:ribosomal protein S18 acetylase RimI-like enzyme